MVGKIPQIGRQVHRLSQNRQMHILATGKNSRLGGPLFQGLTQAGHKITYLERLKPGREGDEDTVLVADLGGIEPDHLRDIMKRTGAQLVINLAAKSAGTYEKMVGVNRDLPQNLADRARELNLPLIHISTMATEIPGVDKTTPYALSKKDVSDMFTDEEAYKHVTIATLSAVVDTANSATPTCVAAAVGQYSPIILLPPTGGGDNFYPVTEAAVIDTLTKLVDKIDKDEAVPRKVTVAGEEIQLKAFLKLVNPYALFSVRVPSGLLKLVTILVDKGVFTNEFTELAKKMASNPERVRKPDLGPMKELGVTPPTAKEVADLARKQLSFYTTTMVILECAIPKMAYLGKAWLTDRWGPGTSS